MHDSIERSSMCYLEIFDIVLSKECDRSTKIVPESLPKDRLFVPVVFSSDVVIAWNDDATLLARLVVEDRIEAIEVAFEFVVTRRETFVEDIAQKQRPVGLDVGIDLREGLGEIPRRMIGMQTTNVPIGCYRSASYRVMNPKAASSFSPIS